MAHVENTDFSRNFEDDLYNDLPLIRDKANQAITDLARKYRGQFDEIDRNFGSYRNGFLQVLEKIIDHAYFEREQHIDDILKDAPIAALVVVAGEIDAKRFGSNGADDFIDDELDGNPYLEGVQRGGGDRSRGRRDIERRSLSGRSGGSRQRGGGGRDRNDRDRDDRNDRGSNRSNLSRNARNNRNEEEQQPKRRGRISGAGKQPERENEPSVPREPVVPQLAIGEVITGHNYRSVQNTSIAPVYLIGHEQVILTDKGYEVTSYTGTNEVDYEKHRIDRFFADILSGKNATSELAAIALREAEKVKDITISGFIKATGEAEETADTKLFNYLKSATYSTPLTLYGFMFEPIEIRNMLIDAHNGDHTWFGTHALCVDINHKVCVANCTNDGLLRLQTLWACKQMHVLVQQLIEISSYIDVAAWKYLHDSITARFNTRLLRNNLMISLSSITADWNDFKNLIAEQYPHLAEVQNSTSGILEGIEIDITEEEAARVICIATMRKTVFMPVGSFDLDIGSPSVQDGYGMVTTDSVIFNALKHHFADTTPGAFVYLTTTDGMLLEVCDASSMLNPQQYIIRRYN